MKIGSYFVVPLCEGTLVRDGGVAFGVMPRSAWSELMPPDADNHVIFAMTSFLVQGHGQNVLIDCGPGEKTPEDEAASLGIHRSASMDALLENVGLRRGDIDTIVLTDLEFTRAGALTHLNEEGALVPGFPNARVVIQQGEWERAIHANVRTRSRYNKEDFEPLLWHQRLELIDGDAEIMPGLWCRVTGGPTKFHQIVVIDDHGEGAVFWGDLIPSRHHFPLNTISAIDLYPLRSMEQKAEWLARMAEKGWISFLSRDPEMSAAMVSGDIRTGVTVEPLITNEVV